MASRVPSACRLDSSGGPDQHAAMVRRLSLLVLALLALVALAVPVSAHVELEPGEAVAGSTATLRFSFHHGLEGMATVGLDVQLPEGASVVDVPEVEGWTSSVDEAEGIVSWTGGSVPDGMDASFPLVVQLPATEGVVLFPAIQIAEDGRELAWISEEEGEGEDANPAPRLTLVADPDAATTSTSEAPTTTAAPDTTTNDLPRTAVEAESRDDGGGSLAPWVVGSGLAALAVIAVGGSLLKRRMG